MVDDVVLNKAATVERCIQRVHQEYEGMGGDLQADITRQDALILNLQRATQACIDLAMHALRVQKLGIPQDSRDAFTLLMQAGFVDQPLGASLQRMVGFRNIAVHDYQTLNLIIVKAIIEHHVSDLLAFTEQAVQTNGFRQPRP